MATVKIILRQDKIKKDGTHPIYLRITKDRKSKYVALGYSINASDWDEEMRVVKSSHSSAQYLNNLIAHKIASANDVALELEIKDNSIGSAKIKEKLTGKTTEDFFKYADKYLSSLEKVGNFGTYKKQKSIIAKIREYQGNKSLTFSEITYTFLKEYEEYLREKLGNKTNTVHTNLKLIRKLINDAINEDLLPSDKNPFSKYKLKQEPSKREYLTEEELKQLENLELNPTINLFHHRNLFVFAVYAGGIRLADVIKLKWKNFDGSNINFRVGKTRNDHSVKLPNKALEILELYKRPTIKEDDYIFPILNSKKDYSDQKFLFNSIASANAYINKNLKILTKRAGINKPISFHCSRHSFATLCLAKGVRIEYVSKLLSHSDIKQTQVYAKIINKELDKAMEVFNEK